MKNNTTRPTRALKCNIRFVCGRFLSSVNKMGGKCIFAYRSREASGIDQMALLFLCVFRASDLLSKFALTYMLDSVCSRSSQQFSSNHLTVLPYAVCSECAVFGCRPTRAFAKKQQLSDAECNIVQQRVHDCVCVCVFIEGLYIYLEGVVLKTEILKRDRFSLSLFCARVNLLAH